MNWRTRAWLTMLGGVDVLFVASVLLALSVPPPAVGGLTIAALTLLVLRSGAVSFKTDGEVVVVRNRWLTHELPRRDLSGLEWSRVGWGVGPTVVVVKVRRRPSTAPWRKKVAIEATATFDVDSMNATWRCIEKRLGLGRK